MRKHIRFFAVIVLASLLGSINIGCVVHSYYGINGFIRDSKTDKPIQGAAVVVVNYAHYSSLGGASYGADDAIEATTGSDGKFILSKKFFWGLGPNHAYYQIYVFDPNYEFVSFDESSRANGIYRADGSPILSIASTKYGKVYEFRLSRLETEAQRKENAADIWIHEFAPITEKFPNFMKVVNTERHKYGIGDVHIWNN
jgi:hypothetical protein